jgi:hypothetical protein
MLHKSATERYAKLKRDFSRLMQNFNRDDLDNFVQTANSLRQWIQRDETLLAEQKAALERFVVPESLDWQICNQLANHQKHGDSSPRHKGRGKDTAPEVRVTGIEITDGARGVHVPPSMKVVGAGEEISIEWEGRKESALAFVIRTFRHFEYIFELALLRPEERVAHSLTDTLLMH